MPQEKGVANGWNGLNLRPCLRQFQRQTNRIETRNKSAAAGVFWVEYDYDIGSVKKQRSLGPLIPGPQVQILGWGFAMPIYNKISSQGKTISDLHENIEDALNVLMRDVVERQELGAFFLKAAQMENLKEKCRQSLQKARFEIPYNIKPEKPT